MPNENKQCCETPCIEWRGTKNYKGYGVVTIDGKQFRVHRLAVILSGRRYPKGAVSDHLCRNRACINPDHIEIVSNVENVMRGESFGAKNALKTHCAKGHSYTEYGYETTPRKGRGTAWRRCRKCDVIDSMHYQNKKKKQNA